MSARGAVLFLIAAVISAFPVLWLTIATRTALGHVAHDGLLDYYRGVHLLVVACCWSGVLAAVTLFIRALRGQHLAQRSHALLFGAVLIGLVGGIAFEIMVASNPIVSFPLGVFVWPALSFVGVALLPRLLPNHQLQRTRASGASRPSHGPLN